MIIHNPILTGSFTVNGTDVSSITSSAASLTSLNAYTASQNNRNGTYATTGSNTFAGIQTVNSNLVVTGSITAQTLVVQTVTSSVVYSSGSNVFGNNIANTQVFTGSMNLTGSLTVVTTGTEFQVNANGVKFGNVIGDAHSITGSVGISGSLSGSSANFSGNVTIKGNTNQQLILDYTTASGGFTWQTFAISGVNKYRIFGNTDNSFILYSDVLASNVLSIASTGATTFSSTVTSKGLVVVGASGGYTTGDNTYINLGGSASPDTFGAINAPFGDVMKFNSYHGYQFKTSNSTASPVTMFSIGISGAATFASSVTSGTEFISYSGINMDAGGGTIRGGLTINYSTGEFKHYCGVTSNSYFQTFHTNGTERMRITSGGVVSINDSGTEANAGLDRFTLGYGIGSYGWLQTWASTPLYLNRLGNNVSAFGSAGFGLITTTSSDVRIKKNIVSIESALDKVNALRGVYFEFDKNNELEVSVPHGKTRVGLIAQEVETIIPEAVIDGDNDGTPKSVDYTGLVGVLVKAIQELKAEIDELKNK